MSTLIVYYSYSNNTKNLVNKIAEKIRCDIFELQPEKPYSKEYEVVVDEGQYEVDNNMRREVKEMPELEKYDRIIIATPTWWYKMSTVVYTFLQDVDLTGKIVIPIMTNAGWPGTVIRDMRKMAEEKGAKVENAKEFVFNKEVLMTSEEEFNNWIEQIK